MLLTIHEALTSRLNDGNNINWQPIKTIWEASIYQQQHKILNWSHIRKKHSKTEPGGFCGENSGEVEQAPTLQENPIYVLPEKKLRGLSPNFHSHVSVSDLYFPKIGNLSSCSRIGSYSGNIEIAHRNMNVRIGIEAARFHFREYLFQIFGILSLQCRGENQVHSKWEDFQKKRLRKSLKPDCILEINTQIWGSKKSN